MRFIGTTPSLTERWIPGDHREGRLELPVLPERVDAAVEQRRLAVVLGAAVEELEGAAARLEREVRRAHEELHELAVVLHELAVERLRLAGRRREDLRLTRRV